MILVVGSGLAGLTAALAASTTADVTLITKGALADTATARAQGGVAAALGADDSPAQHAADTLAAGHGLGDREAVRILTREGPERMRELIALGVPFDRRPDGALARGREAAHGLSRVLHAGGDATGEAIERTLLARLAERVEAGHLVVREYVSLLDLVLCDGRVAGARLRDASAERGRVAGPVTGRVAGRVTGRVTEVAAAAVILATGGAGQLYAHTTNPAGATGEGVAVAWRAGAVLADLEFYQFHPTALAVPGSFLVSEAVRGAGAVLRDEAGRQFMLAEHPLADLAPRDVVARTIARVMAGQGGRPVYLDATGLGGPGGTTRYLATRFPTISRVSARHGFDWAREPIPVTPAAHYWMGGIRTDGEGRSSLPGLYAAGEVACSGAHGANRLASNSLLEASVFGTRAGLAAARDAHGAGADWPVARAAWAADAVRVTAPAGAGRAPDATGEHGPGTPDARIAAIRSLMWNEVGLSRSGDGLLAAAERFAHWASPDPAGDLATLGALIVRAATDRRESRGAHQRRDYPHTDPAPARRQHYVWASPTAPHRPTITQEETCSPPTVSAHLSATLYGRTRPGAISPPSRSSLRMPLPRPGS